MNVISKMKSFRKFNGLVQIIKVQQNNKSPITERLWNPISERFR